MTDNAPRVSMIAGREFMKCMFKSIVGRDPIELRHPFDKSVVFWMETAEMMDSRGKP